MRGWTQEAAGDQRFDADEFSGEYSSSEDTTSRPPTTNTDLFAQVFLGQNPSGSDDDSSVGSAGNYQTQQQPAHATVKSPLVRTRHRRYDDRRSYRLPPEIPLAPVQDNSSYTSRVFITLFTWFSVCLGFGMDVGSYFMLWLQMRDMDDLTGADLLDLADAPGPNATSLTHDQMFKLLGYQVGYGHRVPTELNWYQGIRVGVGSLALSGSALLGLVQCCLANRRGRQFSCGGFVVKALAVFGSVFLLDQLLQIVDYFLLNSEVYTFTDAEIAAAYADVFTLIKQALGFRDGAMTGSWVGAIVGGVGAFLGTGFTIVCCLKPRGLTWSSVDNGYYNVNSSDDEDRAIAFNQESSRSVRLQGSQSQSQFY